MQKGARSAARTGNATSSAPSRPGTALRNTSSGSSRASTPCASLAAMASRLEEAAQLMRRLAAAGFAVERVEGVQRIVHNDPDLFGSYGFVSEEAPERQLDLVLDDLLPDDLSDAGSPPTR